MHRNNEYIMKKTYYGGEAYPTWHAGYPGWDFIPSYLGVELELKEETGWLGHLFPDGSLADVDISKYTIPEDSKWFNFGKRLAYFAVEESKGKCLAGIQAIGGSGDTLAAIRSSKSLLYDLYDSPECVKKWEMHLMDMWTDVFDRYYSILKDGADGGTANFLIWAPGKCYVAHNDFSYMISTKMLKSSSSLRWKNR